MIQETDATNKFTHWDKVSWMVEAFLSSVVLIVTNKTVSTALLFVRNIRKCHP